MWKKRHRNAGPVPPTRVRSPPWSQSCPSASSGQADIDTVEVSPWESILSYGLFLWIFRMTGIVHLVLLSQYIHSQGIFLLLFCSWILVRRAAVFYRAGQRSIGHSKAESTCFLNEKIRAQQNKSKWPQSKPCSFKGRETNGRSGWHSQIGLTIEGSLRQLAESPCGTGNLTGDPELGEAWWQGDSPEHSVYSTVCLGPFSFQELLSHLLLISQSRPAVHTGNPINLIVPER